MKVNRIDRCLGPAIAMLTLLAGCAAAPTSKQSAIEASLRPALPTFNVGTSPTAPPIIFTEGGENVGLEADLARELAAALGMEARLVPMYWPNLIPELRAGRIDIIMAGMSITDDRRRAIAFTDPYLKTGQAALIRAADRQSLGTTHQVLATRRPIGVEVDSTGEAFAEKNIASAEYHSFATLSKAVEALIIGDVDVVIHDQPTILWLASERAGDDLVVVPGRFTDESLAWAVRRDNVALRQEINAILARWKDSGQLEEIVARWVSVPQVDTN